MPTARTLGAAALATIGMALGAPGAMLASAGAAQAQPFGDPSVVSNQPDLGAVSPFYYPGKNTTSPFALSDTPLSEGGDGSQVARRLTPYPLASANGVDLRSFFAFENPRILSEGADGTDFTPDGPVGAAGDAGPGSGAPTGGNTGAGPDGSRGGDGADGEPGSREDS